MVGLFTMNSQCVVFFLFVVLTFAQKEERVCTLPKYPSGGVYDVLDDPDAIVGDTVDSARLLFKCVEGYQLIGDVIITCLQGVWSARLPKCVRFCKLRRHPSVEFWCGGRLCDEQVLHGASVSARCVTGHRYEGTVPKMICNNGHWDQVVYCQESKSVECGVQILNQKLVAGGRRAKLGELPWHVGVYQNFEQRCGGTIISTMVVISAAHCFWTDIDKLLPASQFAVAAGKLNRHWNNTDDKQAQYREVQEIVIPDLYQGRKGRFQEDIAVVIVDFPFEYTDYVRPACLDFTDRLENEQLYKGSLGKVAGWGMTSAYSDYSKLLRSVRLPFVPWKECVSGVTLAFSPYVTSDKICAGYTNGTGVCEGDSGGGLVFPSTDRSLHRFYLRGVVSTAPNEDADCNVHSLAAFTHVTRHERFLTHFLPKPKSNKNETCVLPPYPQHGSYEVSGASNAGPGQAFPYLTLNITCEQGYEVIGRSDVTCQDGKWTGADGRTVIPGANGRVPLPQCTLTVLCRVPKNPSVDYRCRSAGEKEASRPCEDSEPGGTIMKPICRPNYYSPKLINDMRCINGQWSNVAECVPECGRTMSSGERLKRDVSRRALRGEVPWHAGIYSKLNKPYMQLCGGSIISTTAVISAAHCFWSDVSKQLPAANYAVAAGKLFRAFNNQIDTDSQTSDVKEIYLQPYFQGHAGNFRTDIAMVIVQTPFAYNHYVRPVCLDFDLNFEEQQLRSGNIGKLAGWGITSDSEELSEVLLVMDYSVINIVDCISESPPDFRPFLAYENFCARSTNGTSLCKGSSGGGLVFFNEDTGRYYLRGIMSTAPNTEKLCDPSLLTTFNKISHHELFIKQHLNKEDNTND